MVLALLDPHPLRAPVRRLYPQPHNPLFDFSLRAQDARWIEELAEAARAARPGPFGAGGGHTDWTARNVRLDENGLVLAYDWDFLSLGRESVAAAQAAATVAV